MAAAGSCNNSASSAHLSAREQQWHQWPWLCRRKRFWYFLHPLWKQSTVPNSQGIVNPSCPSYLEPWIDKNTQVICFLKLDTPCWPSHWTASAFPCLANTVLHMIYTCKLKLDKIDSLTSFWHLFDISIFSGLDQANDRQPARCAPWQHHHGRSPSFSRGPSLSTSVHYVSCNGWVFICVYMLHDA